MTTTWCAPPTDGRNPKKCFFHTTSWVYYSKFQLYLLPISYPLCFCYIKNPHSSSKVCPFNILFHFLTQRVYRHACQRRGFRCKIIQLTYTITLIYWYWLFLYSSHIASRFCRTIVIVQSLLTYISNALAKHMVSHFVIVSTHNFELTLYIRLDYLRLSSLLCLSLFNLLLLQNLSQKNQQHDCHLIVFCHIQHA